jgi:type 1 glutamine amidotransferase
MRRLLLSLILLLPQAARAADSDPFDQSKVPLELQPTDSKLNKIVLVAGRRSHGPGDHEFFAGCSVLMKLLKQTPGVFPVMARDGWPKDAAATFKDAKSVVFYMDGGGGHPILQHLNDVKALIDSGTGFVNLHYAVEYPKANSDLILSWLGGYYETGYSVNPHWKADFKSYPDHPICRGVQPFSIQDEWYFNIRFAPQATGVTPILKATPPDTVRRNEAAKQFPGREETVAWAFVRPNGGRSFGFTGGHVHKNWGDENFRRLVVNAILWTANLDVPQDGAKVDLNPADLNRNLDKKK